MRNNPNGEYSVFSKNDKNGAGYLHPSYAHALSEFGQPVFLPKCRGWVLKRSIPDCMANDAMGCYPLFTCEYWSSLQSDLEKMDSGWITLTLVADPFGDYTIDYLRACFPDVMIQFKHHFVVDLSKPARSFVASGHLRNVRKARQLVSVELPTNPMMVLDDWIELYDVLINRHQIHGIASFSKQSFVEQIQVPGIVVFRAMADGTTVGMLLWFVMGNIAYYHLGAYSDKGYELNASFALFAFAIDYFADMGLCWLNLGSGTGTHVTNDDGLSRFKKGWSNGSRIAYLCGRVFNHTKYKQIILGKKGLPQAGYFPLYRYGEF